MLAALSLPVKASTVLPQKKEKIVRFYHFLFPPFKISHVIKQLAATFIIPKDTPV